MIQCLKFLMKTKQIKHTRKITSSNATIYALASGFNQKCGVAVVRLSGKTSLNALRKLTNYDAFEPRRLYLRNIWHPVSGTKIDRCMVVWFKGR
jgi:tRNA modification GTPase